MVRYLKGMSDRHLAEEETATQRFIDKVVLITGSAEGMGHAKRDSNLLSTDQELAPLKQVFSEHSKKQASRRAVQAIHDAIPNHNCRLPTHGFSF